MPADKKNWVTPGVRSFDSARIFEQAWTREQLLRVRTLVGEALRLIEADDRLSGAVAELRSILRELDAATTNSEKA